MVLSPHWRWLLYAGGLGAGMLSMSAALGACSDDASCDGGACSGAGGETPIGDTIQDACPDSGVLYGPWSLHFDESSAVVRWDGCAPHSTEIVVEPEDGGEALTFAGEQTASDVRTSYDIIDAVPPDLPGLYYRTEVTADGLSPGSCYRYTLDADSGRGGRFCTARSTGEAFKFFAIGDTNPAIGDTAGVFEHALAEDVDFTIHLGDIQYYQSVFDSWAAWFPAMAPLLQQGAFMPSVGNHEYESELEFQDYYARLFGGAGFDSKAIEWYRFQSGGVYFFSLSTEADLKAGSAQAEWLEASMADAATRPGYRFGVVYFHKPMLTLADYSQKSGERAHFEPLFRAHGIKLVMAGHVHGYERFVSEDVTYVVSGGGGAALHDLEVRRDERPMEAGLRQAASSTYHGTVVEVSDTEILGVATSHTGEELDRFSIPLP